MGIIGMVNKSALCDLIFNAFDVRNAQALTFEDYITSLSTMTLGSQDERMEFSFRILDMDKCGFVNYEEWAIMMKSAGQIMAYIDSYIYLYYIIIIESQVLVMKVNHRK